MIEFLLAARALWSAPGRNLNLLLTVGLAVAAWLVLGVLMAPFLPGDGADSRARSLVSVQTVSRSDELPLRYASRIADLPGVKHVVYSAVVLLSCRQSAPKVSLQAFGGSRDAILDLPIWSAQTPGLRELQARWFDDPTGVLLGPKVAEDCQWRAGIGVSPAEAFSGQPVSINITGIRPSDENPIANITAFGHYDYINRAVMPEDAKDTLGDLIVFPEDSMSALRLSARIEDALAHENPPITANAAAAAEHALAQYGQAQYVLGGVMLAVWLCTSLVLASVLAHSVAQRRANMALLLVLGFTHSMLWRALLLEVLGIMVLAAGLGVAFAIILLKALPFSMGLFFNGFRIPVWAWQGLSIVLVVTGLLALIMPSATIRRLRTTDLLAD